jgi:hypothetical protein
LQLLVMQIIALVSSVERFTWAFQPYYTFDPIFLH